MNLFIYLLFALAAAQASDSGYCENSKGSCSEDVVQSQNEKFILYDVNPVEGFNLRRDVYMRFAIMLSNAHKNGKNLNYNLVLPPWYKMYHWISNTDEATKPVPWQRFFNLTSLKSFTKVIDLKEIPNYEHLEIDVLYVLQNFQKAFEGGVFKEKWEISDDCYYEGFWGHPHISAKEIICVRFQGKASKLWELVNLHKNAQSIMFAHGEIALHDNYGSKEFWDCRVSMRFTDDLIKEANNFVRDHLYCDTEKCNYFAVHWRRQDFARNRKRDIPSIQGTAKQIKDTIENNTLITTSVFIATDATHNEKQRLAKEILSYNLRPVFFEPSLEVSKQHLDGGIAIIEQIICSKAVFFIGTHESTFSFRIQEEREILGFDSDSTFNRFCPDSEPCEEPSKWRIVN